MGLTKIEYGSLASSKILNDNFNFLETEISDLAENLTNKTANFSSQVATLNFNVENLLKFIQKIQDEQKEILNEYLKDI